MILQYRYIYLRIDKTHNKEAVLFVKLLNFKDRNSINSIFKQFASVIFFSYRKLLQNK